MSPDVVRSVAAALVVVLTTSCGGSLGDVRPDEPVAAVPRPSRATAPQVASPAWSGQFDDLDEVLLVEVPSAPRKQRVGEVTREEFKAFMLWALRDVNLGKLKAGLDPPPYEMMTAAWWEKPIEQKDIDITRGYLAVCQREKPGSCIALPPGSPYLTDTQKYRVALGIGMDRFLAGFVKELGDEARAMVDPDALKYMLVGAMVGYMILLANPDPVFTKALAAAATVVVTAMLGARTVCDLVFGFRDMVRAVDAAATFNEFAAAGQQYGEKIGTAAARILVMAVTSLLSSGGAASTLLGFPRLPQASAVLLAETGGAMSLASISKVVGVKVLQGGLYVAMAEAGTEEAGNGATVTPSAAPAPTNPVQLAPGEAGYKTFDGLKKAIGYPPPGYVWHHIVEQCRADVFGNEAVHTRSNVVLLDEKTHLKVSAWYSSKPASGLTGGKTVRAWLRAESYESQRAYGIQYLKAQGVAIP